MNSSSIPPPPKLQMAQVLADLNSLKQAPPQAALSFLRTLSTISNSSHERKTSIHSQPPQKFDRLGRRISPTPGSSSGSQPSSASPSPPPVLRTHTSMTSTDLPETEESKRISRELHLLRKKSSEQDQEFMRAKTLLGYYRNRDRLRERGARVLKLSQDRVDKALTEQAERRSKDRKRSGGKLGESHAGSYF